MYSAIRINFNKNFLKLNSKSFSIIPKIVHYNFSEKPPIRHTKIKSKNPLDKYYDSSQLTVNPNANMYNFKTVYELKRFYYQNRETIVENKLNINQIVNLFDNYIKICMNKLKLSIEEVIEQNMVEELMKLIDRGVNNLSLLSLLKILSLNLSKENKKTNPTLNDFCFKLLKKFNFDKLYDNTQNKFLPKHIIELFTSMAKMQKLIVNSNSNDYLKFFYFRNQLFNKLLSNPNRHELLLENFTNSDLVSLFYIMKKNNLKQENLFRKIADDFMSAKKAKFVNLKGLIMALWTQANLNINYEPLTNFCIEKINQKYKDNFTEEMQKIEKMYIFYLFKFFSFNPQSLNLLDNQIKNNLNQIFDKIFIQLTSSNEVNTEKIAKPLISLYLLESLNYYSKINNTTRINQILNAIIDECDKLPKNLMGIYFDSYLNLLEGQDKMSKLVFDKIMEKANNSRHEFHFKDYIKTSLMLFNVYTKLGDNTNNSIKSFIESSLNETSLKRVIEDFNLTIDLVAYIDAIKNSDLFDAIKENAKNEITIILDSMTTNDALKKTLSFNNSLNLLIIITHLNIDIGETKLTHLLEILTNIKEIKISLKQKIYFNKIFLAFGKEEMKLKIFKSDITSNLLKNNINQNKIINNIKAFKTTLFIETDKILDDYYYFDLYIPSLNMAFIINQSNSGLMNLNFNNLSKNIDTGNFLNNYFKEKMQTEKGLVVHEIYDYMIDDINFKVDKYLI